MSFYVTGATRVYDLTASQVTSPREEFRIRVDGIWLDDKACRFFPSSSPIRLEFDDHLSGIINTQSPSGPDGRYQFTPHVFCETQNQLCKDSVNFPTHMPNVFGIIR